jgi:3-oxoacyl-[acyl-carrier-protein] synthase II
MPAQRRRVVITAAGIISPLGNSPAALWEKLAAGTSGVRRLESLPDSQVPVRIGGEAREFHGSIEDFGNLDKALTRGIRKALRLMCREIEMGVAAAQLALQASGLDLDSFSRDRIGTLFGSDYILTLPSEYTDGVRNCLDEQGRFRMDLWGERGLPKVEPLWLLKYLPNMPASHVAIHNDLRGPSNSLTMREASANVSVAEAVTTIRRGAADVMLAGSTGTRIHPLRSVHVAMQENLVTDFEKPEAACRPFERKRSGMVVGEGAGCLIVEEAEFARRRNATILGEVAGYASSTVADRNGVADYRRAIANVLRGVLETSGMKPREIGHIHAHGLSTVSCDAAEAAAIREVFDGCEVPLVAAKSYMGNLGAGSGLVETVASLEALRHNRLFRILNYEEPDPECAIIAACPEQHEAGDSFINVNITPQGQASAILVKAWRET